MLSLSHILPCVHAFIPIQLSSLYIPISLILLSRYPIFLHYNGSNIYPSTILFLVIHHSFLALDVTFCSLIFFFSYITMHKLIYLFLFLCYFVFHSSFNSIRKIKIRLYIHQPTM